MLYWIGLDIESWLEEAYLRAERNEYACTEVTTRIVYVLVNNTSDEPGTMKIREVASLRHYEEVMARSSRQYERLSMDQAKTRMYQYSVLSECEWSVKLTNLYAISFTYAPLECLSRRRKILLKHRN